MFKTEIYNEKYHLKYFEKWFNYWKLHDARKFENNITIEKFAINRFVLPLVSFYNDELFIFSGLEDISSWVPNTWRIMTKCVGTSIKPLTSHFSLRGKGIENKTYPPKIQGSIQSYIGDILKPNYQQIISTNIDTGLINSQKMGSYMKKPGSKLYDYDGITEKEIWHIKQTLFPVNIDYAISLGEKFYGHKTFYSMANDFLRKIEYK